MKSDRVKWDTRYDRSSGDLREPDRLLVDYAHLLVGGRALDAACGRGGNALFAARSGYGVDALDVSFVALTVQAEEARRQGLPVHPAVVDLDDYPIPRDRYDLIMVFYFFASDIMRPLSDALKPGGLLFYATYNHGHLSEKPEFNPDYLVPPGGLKPFFPVLETILDEPEYGDAGDVSRLIARKPAAGSHTVP